MKRFAAALAIPAILLAATPSSARASDLICGPATSANHYMFCITVQWTVVNSNTLRLQIYNGFTDATHIGTNQLQSDLTRFEIGGLPGSTANWSLVSFGFNDWNGSSLTSTGATNIASMGGWSATGDFPELHMVNQAGSDGPGGNGGVKDCDGGAGTWTTCEGNGAFGANNDWVRFDFNYTNGGLTNAIISNIQFAFKMQNVEAVNGNSVECNGDVTNHNGIYCAPSGAPGTPTDIGVVPEPATMTFMAMGLIGMATAGRRRRKQLQNQR